MVADLGKREGFKEVERGKVYRSGLQIMQN